MDDCSAKSATTAIAGKPPNWYHKRLLSVNTLMQALLDFADKQVLRGLESSLRTKSDSWVTSFLMFKGEQHGLNLLVRFLTFRLYVSTKKQQQQRQLGSAGEGVHLCLLCLRTIMGRQFEQVLVAKKEKPGKEGQGEVTSSSQASSPALNAIALIIAHPNALLSAKSIALELLATVCVMDSGAHHQLVLAAFEHVQREMAEERRFQSLVQLFTTSAPFTVVSVSPVCSSSNIVVNSPFTPPDLNLRVCLQVEFRQLGLDQAYLKKRLQNCSSADQQGHIQAYLDNIIDVGALLAPKTASGDEVCDGDHGERPVKAQIKNTDRVVKPTWRTQMEKAAEKRKMAMLQVQMEERKYQEKFNATQRLEEQK
ncbi:Formin-like protein 2 [Tyrophagus putrescentiae]|nr:Formin-like protein 2 [Tyrophagus putrescentiae]